MPFDKEKIELLYSLIGLARYESAAKKRIRALLLKDTNNGKLYKYQSVTNYHLDCLEDGTLYCSEASQFNDPFDSKMGYKLQDIFDAEYGEELDRLDDILSKFVSVYANEIAISAYSDDEQRIIKELLSNRHLMDTMSKLRLTIKNQENVYGAYLGNPSFFFDLIEPVIEDSSLKSQFMILRNIANDERFRMPVSTESEMDRDEILTGLSEANGITEDTDEVGKIMSLNKRFLQPEKNEALVNLLQKVESEIAKFTNSFRIGCLATDYKNRLMWAHYANCHSGYCVEYDFSGTDQHTMSSLPLPIIYSDHRPRFPWDVMIKPTEKKKNRLNKQLLIGLLTKDEAWKYENEWRIIIENKGDKFVKMPPITCVYLGANMSLEDKERIAEIANKRGIPVKQMMVDRGMYDLHAEEIK
jgi:hypothetical protein